MCEIDFQTNFDRMPQLLKRIGSNLGETESYARDMREYQAIKLAFLSLDPSGSGSVSIDALKQALLASAVPFTMEEVSDLCCEIHALFSV
jgi:hypothetical protein